MSDADALTDFNAGWHDGWRGEPKRKNAGATYNNAYDKAVKARRENDYYG